MTIPYNSSEQTGFERGWAALQEQVDRGLELFERVETLLGRGERAAALNVARKTFKEYYGTVPERDEAGLPLLEDGLDKSPKGATAEED